MEDKIDGLPQEFTTRMREMLGAEYDAFAATYAMPVARGLRVQRAKVADWDAIAPYALAPIPWSPASYYYDEGMEPGKHVLHDVGAYYIQEPSAMAVAAALEARPGERVLDLCAAPGGKTCAIADDMQGQGLLVANEIVPSRAATLARNVERMGIGHCLVLNESPATLAARWRGTFDRIVVDAPCSGEGMFRKTPAARAEWSVDNVEMCARRQYEILSSAQRLLRPGGVLVYSTCTFSPQENEYLIARFLAAYPEFEPSALPAAVPGARDADAYMQRLYPHRLRGEGHFIARLRKRGDGASQIDAAACAPSKRDLQTWNAFADDTLARALCPNERIGDTLCLTPLHPDLRGIRALRTGLHLGRVVKDRIEPDHALAVRDGHGWFVRTLDLADDVSAAFRYLRGETLDCPHKGWGVATVFGLALGWYKGDGRIAKNHYPKGLRRR